MLLLLVSEWRKLGACDVCRNLLLLFVGLVALLTPGATSWPLPPPCPCTQAAALLLPAGPDCGAQARAAARRPQPAPGAVRCVHGRGHGGLAAAALVCCTCSPPLCTPHVFPPRAWCPARLAPDAPTPPLCQATAACTPSVAPALWPRRPASSRSAAALHAPSRVHPCAGPACLAQQGGVALAVCKQAACCHPADSAAPLETQSTYCASRLCPALPAAEVWRQARPGGLRDSPHDGAPAAAGHVLRWQVKRACSGACQPACCQLARWQRVAATKLQPRLGSIHCQSEHDGGLT